jgi:hypothetical protein
MCRIGTDCGGYCSYLQEKRKPTINKWGKNTNIAIDMAIYDKIWCKYINYNRTYGF